MGNLDDMILEGVYRGDPDSRETWHSPLVYVCRACHKESPQHNKDCPVLVLQQRVEALESENRILKVNTSKSVLRRLEVQGALATTQDSAGEQGEG